MTALQSIIVRFLDGTTTPAEFDRSYFNEYRDLPGDFDPTTERALERLFCACEDYVDESSIRDARDLDEKQLRAASQAVATEVFGL